MSEGSNHSWQTSSPVETFEEIVHRLNAVLISLISKFEMPEGETETPKDLQLKELTGIFKLLQGVEEMIKKIQENRDRQRDSGIDALEFRRKLEQQIAQIVDTQTEGDLP